jgi:DNA-binding transcriptional ArsR family regulator
MEPVFHAIADSSRRQMLQRLASGPRPASELGRGLRMSQPAVSQHLKVLREAGLVSVEPAGRRRLYRLRPEGLQAVHDWVQTFERFWAERLGDLEQVLRDMPDEGGSDV